MINYCSRVNGLSRCLVPMPRDQFSCHYSLMRSPPGSNALKCIYFRSDIDNGCDCLKAQLAMEAASTEAEGTVWG